MPAAPLVGGVVSAGGGETEVVWDGATMLVLGVPMLGVPTLLGTTGGGATVVGRIGVSTGRVTSTEVGIGGTTGVSTGKEMAGELTLGTTTVGITVG